LDWKKDVAHRCVWVGGWGFGGVWCLGGVGVVWGGGGGVGGGGGGGVVVGGGGGVFFFGWWRGGGKGGGGEVWVFVLEVD